MGDAFDGSKLCYVDHRADEHVDEIRILVLGAPFLRLRMVPRYKTSGLSGDEWRVSAAWQYMPDRGPARDWTDFDTGYGSIKTAVAAIYPGVWMSHKAWHNFESTSAQLYRKGRPIIEMTHDGKSLPLLAALGHLPWALIVWREPPNTDDLCFQVGCSAPAVVTYGLKKRYAHDGKESEAVDYRGRRHARRYCTRHMVRGDCGLDDADVNYDRLDGPGPEVSTMRATDESPSVFGGVIGMDGENDG